MLIIQDRVFGDEQEKLIEAAKQNELGYKIVEKPIFTSAHHMIPRGSVEFVEKYINYININIDSYTYSYYSTFFKSHLFNSDFIILPWWYLNYTSWFLDLFKTDRLFIRPNSGRKIFTGTTLTKKWWNKELRIISQLPNSNIKDDDLVVISSAKEIKSEYRVLLHEYDIIDYSWYSGEESKLNIYSELRDLLFLNCFAPDEYWVMDIAYNGYQWKILEINNGFSSGWYDMNYNRIISYIAKQKF